MGPMHGIHLEFTDVRPSNTYCRISPDMSSLAISARSLGLSLCDIKIFNKVP